METNIISKIADTERQAAERKAQATLRAAQIVTEAEKQAESIAKKSESACSLLRETALKNATERAQKEYEKTLRKCREESERYADELLKGAEGYVIQIVGRLTK